MSGVHYAKSFYDLMQNAEFKKAVVEEDKKKMEELLFSIGFDISQGYDLVSVLHRPETTKQPWMGVRVEGFERTDKAWLDSPYASLEAHIGACPDASKRVHLAMLNPRGAISSWEDD